MVEACLISYKKEHPEKGMPRIFVQLFPAA